MVNLAVWFQGEEEGKSRRKSRAGEAVLEALVLDVGMKSNSRTEFGRVFFKVCVWMIVEAGDEII